MHPHAPAVVLGVVLALVVACGEKADDEEPCPSAASGATSTDCATSTTSGRVTSGGGPVAQDLPPVPGTGPAFASVAWNGYMVSWTAATDDHTAAAELQYQLVSASDATKLATVQQAAAVTGGDIALAWSANALSATISGATQKAALTYAVLVKDGVGSLALFPAQTVTPPTLVLSLPVPGTGITISTYSPTITLISWGAASSPGATVEYQVVFAATAAAIDSVDEAVAHGANTGRPWYASTVQGIGISGAGSGAVSFAAVVVRNSVGQALYPPVFTAP